MRTVDVFPFLKSVALASSPGINEAIIFSIVFEFFIGIEFIATRMSPALIPALEAGPQRRIQATKVPSVVLRSKDSANSRERS